MRQVLLIAKTEISRSLTSPVSIAFLGVFLLISYLSFFNQGRFFARNIADLRPLFDSMPLLLILVVSALAMRGWAEERQRRQSEHLFSLPVPIHHWVMGRFYGGMGLIAAALIGTFPMVLTVALTGDLDWGPVFCGYVGALLLGAAYLALGLCLSAATSHQMVALVGTTVVGGALYLLGSEAITSFVSASTGDWLRAISTSSRFDSLAKGVLDLGDVTYFLALTALFLLLNGLLIAQRPLDLEGKKDRRFAVKLLGVGALAILNLFLYVGWTHTGNKVQFDLTEGKVHSLHGVAKEVIGDLAEPISIRGLFSNHNHPKLSPFVPQLRDTLFAFQQSASEQLTVRIEDPNADLDIQQEIAEVYGIVSRPIRISEAHQKTIINAYFAILIEQGSQHVILSMEDLLTKHPTPLGVEFELGNVEYAITKAIKDLARDSLPIETAVGRLKEPIKITTWQTSSLVPSSLQNSQKLFEQAGKELQQSYPDKFTFEAKEFDGNPSTATQLQQNFGIVPIALEDSPDKPFYLDLLIEITPGTHLVIHPRSTLDAYEVRTQIEQFVRSSHPAYSKRVSLITEPGQPQTSNGNSSRDFRLLEEALRKEYQVHLGDPTALDLAGDVDVVLISKPGTLAPNSIEVLHRFLSSGGTIIATYGAHKVNLSRRAGLVSRPSEPSLAGLLDAWGMSVGNRAWVADDRNAPFTLPIIQRKNGKMRQWVEELDYPLFPEVRAEQASIDHPALKGIAPVTVPWSSPVTWDAQKNPALKQNTLLTSSKTTYTLASSLLIPDPITYPDTGFPGGDQAAPKPLLMMVEGNFGPPSDVPGRIFLIPSSEFVSDFILDLARQVRGESHGGNLQLLLNLIDWSTEDTQLMELRRAGAYHRKLYPHSTESTRRVEWANYFAALCYLSLLVLWPRFRRHRSRHTRKAS